MQLYYVEFDDGCGGYIKEDEYDDFARAMALLSIHYVTVVITEPMYVIHWYDEIDDEWTVEWLASKDEFNDVMADIIDAGVAYEIETFNI